MNMRLMLVLGNLAVACLNAVIFAVSNYPFNFIAMIISLSAAIFIGAV